MEEFKSFLIEQNLSKKSVETRIRRLKRVKKTLMLSQETLNETVLDG